MAQEVGVAYVTLLPSGRGFGKAVEGQVDQAIGNSEKKTNGFFSKVGKGLKVVGGLVAGVVATVGGIAIAGGISRALNIEDAQAKLKGLGHDAKSVDQIMTDALASVKGTAFGLDAAATTAAAAVASGIKPGQELEKYLRLTADAATIAGVSMEEMGSIVNKVQAKGKAQMEDLNRLTERGIPILQMLADEYGVTAEEMSKMVSKGEVDAERFRKALEDNVGGAALESGNTTRGAFANMRAALSRLGLAFVGDGLSGAKTFFNEMTVIFDGLTDRVGPWVERIQSKLGEMFQIEGMGDSFLGWLDRAISAVANGPIPQLLSALAPVIPALAEMARIVGSALGEAFLELGNALAPILPMLAETLAQAVVELAPSLTDLLVALIPLIPPLVELAAAILPVVTVILEALLPAITWLAEGMAQGMDSMSAFFDVLSGDQSLDEWVAGLVESGGMLASWLLGLMNAILGVAKWVNTTLAQFRAWYAGAVGVFTSIGSFFTGIWASITSTFSTGVNRALGFVQSLPGRIRGALSGAASWLVQTGRDIIQGLINGVRGMIDRAVQAVKDVGGSMLSSVKSFLGIESPSRVFRDEVGKMVGLGLLEGVEDRAIHRRIDTAVRHLVEVPNASAGRAAEVVQRNEIHLHERDPRLLMRQLGRELEVAL